LLAYCHLPPHATRQRIVHNPKDPQLHNHNHNHNPPPRRPLLDGALKSFIPSININT
jgi:hypothetical protein